MKRATTLRATLVSLLMLTGLVFFPVLVRAEGVGTKIKEAIDDVAEGLKKGVSKLGDDIEAAQRYLDNYHWKGVIEKEATSGPITLCDLKMKGRHRAVVVQPGESIQCTVHCHVNKDQLSSTAYYRVVMGFKGLGGQTTIFNSFGINAEDIKEQFDLVAPSQPGLYQIRFRTVDTFLESEALASWCEDNGQEPSAKTTLGVVLVKP